ncbi:MAG: type II toxin-antitoxin system VapC family toxin [Candidatus Anstonellales archaeon]
MAKDKIKICLDLDILLDFLLGDESAVEKIEIYVKTRDTELCISTITLAELYIITKNRQIIDEIKERFIILPFDENAAKIAGDVYDYLEEQVPISQNRVFVAATCMANNAFLLTKDKKYYSNSPNLRVL